MSNRRNKPFSSRFTMVQHRRSGCLGVVEELSAAGMGVREFNIVWEDGTDSRLVRGLRYTPKDLLTETIAVNPRAKRLVVELATGRWWVEEPGDSPPAAA